MHIVGRAEFQYTVLLCFKHFWIELTHMLTNTKFLKCCLAAIFFS
jgi:hypothetical protein